MSPGFRELLDQPRLIRAFGLPVSKSQDVTVPPSSFTSRMKCACGFVHSIFATVPVSVMGFCGVKLRGKRVMGLQRTLGHQQRDAHGQDM